MKFTNLKYAFGLFLLPISLTVFAQEDSTKLSDVEEVVVVGSQIKGAKITGALPVSVFSGKDIEALGVDGGDELLENIAEQGLNYFNEAEDALNLPIKKIIFDGPKELLNETENTQPAIFLVSYSIFNVIKNETSLYIIHLFHIIIIYLFFSY